MQLHETDPLLERRMTAWNDPDREGAWRLYTLCRGCAEVKFCRGKERDGVVCLDCFLSDAPKVPFFELGLRTAYRSPT